MRAMWSTLTSAPWRRAPLLLWRRPGVLATVAGACAVLVAALASVPLFLSSVGTASVAIQAAERCPRDTGATRASSATPDDVRSPSPAPFGPLGDALGPSTWWARMQLVPLTGGAAGEDLAQTSVLVQDEAADHVDVLGGPRGEGIWITDRAAARSGLSVGDQARLGGIALPVSAIYRDLSGNRVDPFWCSHADLLLIEVVNGDLRRPPPVVLADRDTFARVMGGMGMPHARSAWEAPLRPDTTVARADELIRQLACRTDEAPALAWCGDGQPLVPRRAGGLSREPVAANGDADFVRRYFQSALPFVTDRSRAIGTSVGSGIWPVAAFAGLAGAGLVAAAASLWFDRRSRELTLLTVRGISPAALGLKAVLELSGALVAGAVAGTAIAYGLVVSLGPSPVIEASATGRAAWGAAVGLLAAVATVVAVVIARIRAAEVQHRRRRRLRIGVLPWEVAAIWATVVSYRRLGDWGLPVGRGAEVSRVDVWGLLFPVLFLVTAVAVLSRVLGVTIRPLRSASRRWSDVLYLAVRRLARYRVAVLGLVAAAAVAAGVLGYAATMNRSLDATLRAKAQTFVGSDLALGLPAGTALPDGLERSSTSVDVHNDAWVEDERRESVIVQGIDPETFARAAFWDETFSEAPLSAIVDRLSAPPDGGAVPAVVVGAELGGPVDAAISEGTTRRFTIEPVAEVESFPGMRRGKPTVFVASEALEPLELRGSRTETWIAGDPERTMKALEQAGISFEERRSADEVADGSSFVTIGWTFGFMQSLGISAGVLVLGGVAVYLDARRRDRLLGYTFLRRMGLSRRQHGRALLAELSASVLVGCWTGLAIALVAAWLAHGRIDPVPGFHPAPLLRPASALALLVGLGSLAVTALAAALAQRRMDRDDPVEVLRAGV